MSEVVALERRETVSWETTALAELPKWVGTRRGAYWHIPRSGHVWDDGQVRVTAWCGQDLGSRRSQPLRFLDRRPSAMICGTCEGRYAGAREATDTVFRPRSDPWLVPRWCPSCSTDDGRYCIACGEHLGYRSGYAARHRPGERFAALVRPCPDHGYKHASDRGGLIVCTRHVGFGWGTCDFPMRVS